MKKDDKVTPSTFYELTNFSSATIFKFKFVNDEALKRATDLLNAMECSKRHRRCFKEHAFNQLQKIHHYR